MSVLCGGKKTLPVIKGVYEPLVIELSFPGDLTQPPAGHEYVVSVKITKPDGSELLYATNLNPATVEVIGPSSIRIWVDTRESGDFAQLGFYNFRVFVQEQDSADPNVIYQVWGAEGDACLYVYEQSPCPEGPCNG